MVKPFYKSGDFAARRSLGYLIRRLNNLIVPRAEALFADAEISFTQWIMLKSVRDGVAATAGEIARHLGHDTGATTRLVDQMEKRGLLVRRRCTDDRRVVYLDITPAGKALINRLTPRMLEFWNRTLERTFKPAEAEQLIASLTRLMDHLEQEDEAAAVTDPRK